MGSPRNGFTIGVEEEYQIVDARTGELRSRSGEVIPYVKRSVGDDVQPELYQSQMEIGTSVCETLSEVREELVRLRRQILAGANDHGHSIAAAGTHPFSHWREQEVTPKDRYRRLQASFQQLAREQIIFGCHVHIGMSDRNAAIKTMARARLWLAPLVALTANSPYWLGEDSGYASFGREMWRRWPLAGIPPELASERQYDELVDSLVEIEIIKDATKIYWDIRPSTRFETLEFRATDVCMTVDEAVMLAGLVRALTRACHRESQESKPAPSVPYEILVAANWRATRDGLEGRLVDMDLNELVPAKDAVYKLLEFVRSDLEDADEWEQVNDSVYRVLTEGNGAMRQRKIFEETGNIRDVVGYIARETAKSL